MPRVILAPRARRWLHAELAYLTDVYPSAAGRLRERIATARRLISEHPRIGRPEPTTRSRRLVVVPYVVIYREKGSDIEIMDIRHSRDPARPLPDNME
jgi:plasmid stabilization system protein ParE